MKSRPAQGQSLPRRALINAFIVAYVVLLSLTLMPGSWAWRNAVLRMFNPIILYAGLWQNYSVFSPNVRDINLHIEAIVTYQDGTQIVWPFPRMERLPLFHRIYLERYRKFGHDHLNWDHERVLWPDFARFVARRMNDRGDNKPREIVLKRYWQRIPPPQVGLGRPAPEHINAYEFYRYNVRPEDLQS